THKTVYGETIADANGMTLYTLDNDEVRGRPACDRVCLETWLPFAAPRIGKASGDWSIATRDDGTRQWAYRGKPTYRFAGDNSPGDANGDGIGDRWHAVLLSREFLPVGLAIRPTDYGPTLVTSDGRTLYMMVAYTYDISQVETARHQASPPPSA